MNFYNRIPDGELEVMQAIWNCTPPVSRTDIEAVIRKKHPIATTTLLTVLSRLAKKGLLEVKKEGKNNFYTPLISLDQYSSEQGRFIFKRLCGGSVSALASALCDSGLSSKEIRELRKLLKEYDE